MTFLAGMTHSIFVACWFVGVIAFFWGAHSFHSWWFAKLRGAEPPEDALGKSLYAAGIFTLVAAVGCAAAVVGELVGGSR